MTRYCALIPGVTGVVGRGLASYLAAQPDWEVIGLSRRVPQEPTSYPVIPVDLADAAACRARLGELTNVTHVLYCACANQAYNVTNGDFIRWENLWPRVAEFFGMAAGPVKTVRLAQVMADKAPVWERLVTEHRLTPTPYAQAALWPYGDFVFTPGYDHMSDTVKLRQSGFTDCLDTGRMLLDAFQHLRDARVIP